MSTRVVFEEGSNGQAVLLSEHHSYPFGMELKGDFGTDKSVKRLYNFKERIGDFGLNWSDFGARYYLGNGGEPVFVSIDPLAEKYRTLSPYNFVMGNPIKYIDPDGRQVEPVITKGGGKDGRDLLTLRVTGKIINFSNNNVNMGEALKSIKSMVESSFKGENINGMDVNMELNFSIAESMEDVADNDHLLVLAEEKNDKIPGVSNGLGGKVAAVDADYFTGLYDRFIGEEGERTSAHELGHLFGLTHGSGGKDSNNLMTQGEAYKRGNEITKSQLNSILKNLAQNKLNQGSNFNLQGLPNLGIGSRVMRLTNTAGRNRKMTMQEIQKMINKN
jgi:RHS repeat-associated protein